MSILVVFVSIAVLFLVTAYLVVSTVGPSILLKPLRKDEKWYREKYASLTPREAGLPEEDMTVTTDDGLRLRCWLIRAEPPVSGTVVYLHGVGDSRISGIQRARWFHDHRFHVLLPDLRRHGDSEGEYCTYGYHEKHDIRRMIDSLQERVDPEVGRVLLFGLSMGAAMALQAAVIDDRIRLVISEGCFSDLRTITLDYQERYISFRSSLIGNIVIRRSENLAGFRADDVSPLRAVERIRIPTLFSHGRNDPLISPEYSRMLYERARGPKELYYIDGAAHADAWEAGEPGYRARILRFIQQHFS